jgi:hypothetical protein
MSIKSVVEKSIQQLGGEFLEEPYRYFTESDAVARFHQLLENSGINSLVNSKDGYAIPQVHREYPTFFRFSDKNPTARLPAESKASRGHYDTVILNPEFILNHVSETVTNRDIRKIADNHITPFEAVIEFKLYTIGWSAGRSKGAIAELGKLELTTEAPLKYFVVLMRYTSPKMTRWHRYWPTVSKVASDAQGIGSYFAIQWLSPEKSGQEEFLYGDWLKSN